MQRHGSKESGWCEPFREIEAAAHCRRRFGQLRAVQILFGHTKIESTVRYLGIEIDDALAIAEQVDV